MKKEKSCGAVVYRETGEQIEILLIRREETGLEVLLDTGFRRVVTYLPKPNVKKDVVYFAARFQSGSPEAQPEEVMDIVWASPDKALQLVTYQNDVETLEAFLDYEKN